MTLLTTIEILLHARILITRARAAQAIYFQGSPRNKDEWVTGRAWEEVPCRMYGRVAERKKQSLNLAAGYQSYSVKCDKGLAKRSSARTHGRSYPPVGS